MPDWKDFLSVLANKLTAQILIFGVIIVVVVAFLGDYIPPVFQTLIYIVVILVIVVYVIERVLGVLGKEEKRDSKETRPEESQETAELPVEQPEFTPLPPSTPTIEQPAPTVISVESLREDYLGSIIADCSRLRLVGLDPQASDPTRGGFSLEDLYISLNTRTPVKEEDMEGRERSRNLTALEALSQAKDRHMVLLGLPGSGKSTFVRYLALCMAQAQCDPSIDVNRLLPGWSGQALLPVIIPLGRFAESIPEGTRQGDAVLVERYLEAAVSADKRCQDYSQYLLGDLKNRGGILLFDGLDEVANLETRPLVVQAVEDFAREYRKNQAIRFLVTCRTFSYTDPDWQLTAWPTHELAPFDNEKIDQFITAWHDELVLVDRARSADYEEKRNKMLEALRPGDRRRLYEIADNPLILTVMCVVHTHKGDLPDARALVYEECIDLLLLRWELQRSVQLGDSTEQQKRSLLDALDVPRITLERTFQEVAYMAHRSQPFEGEQDERERAALVTEDLLTGILYANLRDPHKVQTFLEYSESANGLLMLQGVAQLPGLPRDAAPRRVYAFPHLTFEEYLAGRFLGRKPNLSREVRSHLEQSSDRWREVVMLLGEHLCFREGDFERMDGILERLAPETFPEPMEDHDWRALWMAGDLLVLYRRAMQGRPQADERTVRDLSNLVERGALTPRERSTAGNTLAQLGDPRFNPAKWYLPKDSRLGFIEVPAGAFLMGSDPQKDGGAGDDEQPQHEITLSKYYIARYPVTVAQFQSFVDDSDFEPGDADSLRSLPNHPVVRVSWHEALKYCEWLTGKLRAYAREPGREVAEEQAFWESMAGGELVATLPSEAQWEKAARGADGRIYPWEGEFSANNANTVQTGIGSTSSAGCFPGGASPYGALDMSGNVWEWTRSLWGKVWEKPDYDYPYDPADGREDLSAEDNVLRLVRGGAFVNSHLAARCAVRYWYSPDYHFRNRGFRVVVCAPPNSER